MEITLEDAYHGKTAELRIPTSVTCETCSGTGAKPGTQAEDLHAPAAAPEKSAMRRASSRSSAPARRAMAAAR